MTFTFSKSRQFLVSSIAIAATLTPTAFAQLKEVSPKTVEESKYVGETTKNLNALEAGAPDAASIQFDEADALFSKRGDLNAAPAKAVHVKTEDVIASIGLDASRTAPTGGTPDVGDGTINGPMRELIDPAFLRRMRVAKETPLAGETIKPAKRNPDFDIRKQAVDSYSVDGLQKMDGVTLSGPSSDAPLQEGRMITDRNFNALSTGIDNGKPVQFQQPDPELVDKTSKPAAYDRLNKVYADVK